MIAKLKQIFGGSKKKKYKYRCTECETKFSLPENTPVECPDCHSSEFVFPERNILISNHRCTDCRSTFAFPEDTELICPDCESTNVTSSPR